MNTSYAHNVSFHDPDSACPTGSPFRPRPDHAQPEPDNAGSKDPEGAGVGRGRPSTCTLEQVQLICSFIRLTGLSDTAAAAMAGVKRSTLARWKKEEDDVELMLDQARFQYQAPRLAKIDETRMKDGQPDWRAQAWLVKFANPEVHGAPSRRRKLSDVELGPTPEEKRAQEEAEARAEMDQALEDWGEFHQIGGEAFFQSGKKITPAMLALLQRRRAIALREMNAEKPGAEEGDNQTIGQSDNQTEPRESGIPGGAMGNDGGAHSVAPRDSGDPRGSGAPAAAEVAAKNVTIRPENRGLYRYPDTSRRAGAMAG